MELKKYQNQLLSIAGMFIVLVIVFKILYYKESFVVVLRLAASLFWLFTLPGMALLYAWNEKLNVAVLMVLGTVLGLAVVGMSSYYTGLIGLHLKYQTAVLPAVIIIIALVLIFKKK